MNDDGPTCGRDWFASQAPSLTLFNIRDLLGWPKGLLEGNGDEDFDFEDTIISRYNALTAEERAEVEAEWAYLYADAMLERRKKK